MAGISTAFYSSMSYQTNFEPMVFLSFSMVFLWFPMVLRGPLRVPVSRQDSVATRQSTGHGSLGSGGRGWISRPFRRVVMVLVMAIVMMMMNMHMNMNMNHNPQFISWDGGAVAALPDGHRGTSVSRNGGASGAVSSVSCHPGLQTLVQAKTISEFPSAPYYMYIYICIYIYVYVYYMCIYIIYICILYVYIIYICICIYTYYT